MNKQMTVDQLLEKLSSIKRRSVYGKYIRTWIFSKDFRYDWMHIVSSDYSNQGVYA